MVTLSEAETNIRTAKSNIAQARTQSEQAEEVLQQAKEKLPEVRSQQALRQKFAGLQGRTARQKVVGAETEIVGKQGEVQKYKEEVTKYEEEVKQAEKELEEYKYTPAGKLQYAKEMGLKPDPRKSYSDRPYYNYSLISVPVYETPYGDVADTTDLDKAKAQAYKTEAKVAGFTGIEEQQRFGAFTSLFGGKGESVNKIGASAYEYGMAQEQLSSLSGTNIRDVKPVDVQSFLGGQEVKLGDTSLKMDTTTGTINAVTQRLDRTTRMQEGFLKPSLIDSNKDLNTNATSNINGTSTLLSGNIIRTDSSQSIRNRIGGWVSKFIGTGKDFKKGTEEVYQSGIGEAGAFVQAYQPTDTGTLQGIRLPNPAERVVIEEGNIRDKAVWQVPVQYATLGYANFGKQMPSDVQKIIEQPNVFKFGLQYLSPKTQYRIAEFNVRQEEAVKKMNLLNKPLYQAEEDYKAGKISQEQYNAQINKAVESPQYIKAMETYEQRRLTPEQVLTLSSATKTQKVIAGGIIGGGEVVSYFNPVSRVILGAEQVRVSSEALDLAQTNWDKTKAGAGILLGTGLAISGVKPLFGTTSSVATASRTVQNPFVRSLKTYSTLTAGVGLASYFGVEQGISAYKSTGDISYSIGKGLGTFTGIAIPTGMKYVKDTSPDLKFLEKPEVRVERKRVEMIENKMSETQTAPKLSLIKKEGGGGKVSVSEVNKGKTEVTEYYPSEKQRVDIIEQRNLQPIRNQLRSLFGIKPKLESYKGEGVYIEGKGYKEIIDYGKYKKVTNINNLGRGTIKLVDTKGRTVSKSKVSPNKEIDVFGKVKRKETKIKIDENIQNKVNVLEIKSDKGTNKQAQTQEGGDIILDEFGNKIIPNTKSSKVFAEFETTTKQSSNLEKGKAKVEVEQSGFLDIIETSPRVGTVNIFKDGKNVQVKKSVSQENVYGISKEKDIVKGTVGEKGGIVFASYSPKSNRQIKQVSGAEQVNIYVNPQSTILKPARKLAELQRKETRRLVNQLNREKNIDRFNTVVKDLKDKFNIAKQNMANRINLVKDKFTKEKPIVSTEGEGLPKMVGGTGLVMEEQLFIDGLSNKFVVESPQSFIKNRPNVKMGEVPSYEIDSGIITSSANLPTLRFGMTTTQAEELKVENMIKPSLKVESNNQIIPLEKVNLNIQNNLKVETKSVQELKLKLNQLSKQEFKLQEQKLLETRTQRPSRPETRTIKKPKPFAFDMDIPIEKKFGTAKETLAQLYEAFARTKGEDISLGKFTTKREAEDILSKQLKSTLKASGFVEQAGRRLRATELGLGGIEFAPSKVDIFRIVQRKGRRLSARPEVSEIQFFKSKARKRSSFL